MLNKGLYFCRNTTQNICYLLRGAYTKFEAHGTVYSPWDITKQTNKKSLDNWREPFFGNLLKGYTHAATLHFILHEYACRTMTDTFAWNSAQPARHQWWLTVMFTCLFFIHIQIYSGLKWDSLQLTIWTLQLDLLQCYRDLSVSTALMKCMLHAK